MIEYQPRNFKYTEYYKNWCNEYKHPKENIPQTDKPTLKQNNKVVLMFIFGFIGFIVGSVVSCSVSINSSPYRRIFGPAVIITIIGGALGLIIGAAIDRNNKQEYNNYLKAKQKIDKEKQESENYNNKRYYYWLNKFQEEENQNKQNYGTKRLMKIDVIEKEMALIQTQLDKIESALDSLYNFTINGELCLHPAYRGLTPVATIYGYIDTGKCTQLKGHEGAYTLYDNEIRLGIIIDKLDEISMQLDDLKGSMSYLGNAVYECNKKLDVLKENNLRTIQVIEDMDSNMTERIADISGSVSNISTKISKIEVNSANSAYYSEVGAQMATFIAYYNSLKN